MTLHPRVEAIALTLFLIVVAACSSPIPDPPDADAGGDEVEVFDPCKPTEVTPWQTLTFCRMQGQMLSVWGTAKDDVWSVGAGGQVLHFDGCKWEELASGTQSDLWWAYGFKDGPVYIVGQNGTILRYSAAGGFEAMESGTDVTLFGVWGTAPDNMYTIGFMFDNSKPGVILHFDGSTWTKVDGLPDVVTDTSNFFKVWGSAADDVWVVGRNDMVLHWDGKGWSSEATGIDTDWVTITGRLKENGTLDAVIVGGKGSARIVQHTSSGWVDVSPDGFPSLQGVCMQADGSAVATGMGATILTGAPGFPWGEALDAPFDLFSPIEPPVAGCGQPTPDYHACWMDGEGGVFVVGGNFLGPLTEGAILHYGDPISGAGLAP